jgi:hypothetical protein
MDQRRSQQQRRRPVNVAEIMTQIRRRIEQKKKDLNYGTELEDLAVMKLKPLPDPQQVRPMRASGLYIEGGRQLTDVLSGKQEPLPPLVDPFTRPALEFEKPNVSAEALFYSSRGASGRILMLIRKVTRPLLKLFVNLDAYVYEQAHVNQVLRNQTVEVYERLHQQLVDLRNRDDQIVHRIDSLREWFQSTAYLTDKTTHYVRLLHGIQTSLVAELTKLAIENQNLKSRLAELDGRLDMQGKRESILEEQVQRIEVTVAPSSSEPSVSDKQEDTQADAPPDRS